MKLTTHVIAVLWLLFLGTQPSLRSAGAQDADALFSQGRFSEAAVAYEALTKSNPDSATTWMRLGIARHQTGEFARAIEAFRRAQELFPPGPMRAGALFRRSRAHTRNNDLSAAFEALDLALKSGYENLQAIKTDTDLAGLRADPRFTETLALAERELRPGLHLEEYSQLAFLVGEWDVTMGGQPLAESVVRAEQDSCLLVEEYAQPDGSTAKTFFYFDAAPRRWRKTNVSNTAAVTEASGELRGESMCFEGEWRTRHNGVTKFRETLTPLADDRVRQLFETTSDGGATWSVMYDLTYVRRG